MRIVFICGCLEPGRDGVGDYARLLGKALAERGNQVMLLSIYDYYQTTALKFIEERGGIKIIRISSKGNLNKRCSLAKKELEAFNPKWVSLQYVPYSFHKKGMELRLPQFFASLRGNYQWHLMIHEPWVVGRSFFSKNRIIEWVQKNILRLLVKKLDPSMIHTSNPHYQHILQEGGVKSALLHIPSNIPFEEGPSYSIDQEFQDLGLGEESREEWIVLGTFGCLRPGVAYLKLLQKVTESPEAAGKNIALLSIGKTGPHASSVFNDLKNAFGKVVLIHEFGFRTTSEISRFFRLLDYGVASVPGHLLGKSGSYAAMRIHRLKILVPEPGTQKETEYFNEKCSSFLQKLADEDFSSERVAQAMISSLNHASTSIKHNYEHSLYHAQFLSKGWRY